MKKSFYSPKKLIGAFALIVGTFYFNSCTKDAGPIIKDSPNTMVSYSNEVQPIFNQYCTPGCHSGSNPSRGLNLTSSGSRNHIVNVLSLDWAPMVLVKPHNADSSILWLRIQDVSGNWNGQMPPNQALTPIDMATIKKWINQGALDN